MTRQQDSKFDRLPQDADTRIKAQQQINAGGTDALHQRWVWDGIAGESLIFCAADIPGATNEQIVQLARNAGLTVADDDYTIKRTDEGFVFLNYGFDT